MYSHSELDPTTLVAAHNEMVRLSGEGEKYEQGTNKCLLCGKPFTHGEDGNELGFCCTCQEADDFPYDIDAYYLDYDNGKVAFKGFDTMNRGLLENYRK
jgi:hypothetical protein